MPKTKDFDPRDEYFTVAVKESGKEFVQDSNSDQIFVVVEIKDHLGKVVETRRMGFELTAKEDFVAEQLQKLAKIYNDEYQHSLTQRVIDEKHENADNVISSLNGLEIDAKGAILDKEPEE